MSDQEEKVAAKIITVKTIKKKPRNPADDENKKNYETDIVMKNDVKVFKLINNNYWKWAKSMRMNLLDRRIWKIVNGNAFKPIKSKNKILWMYDDVVVMSYITKNLDNEQLKYVIECEIIKKVWNTFTNIHNSQKRNWLNILFNNFYAYKTKFNATVDQIVAEIKKMAIVIEKIKMIERFSDLILILILIKMINGNQYVLIKWQLKKTKDFIFMFVLKKFKTVELNNQNKNIITTSVIKIVNKITGNGADKKKKVQRWIFSL